MTTRTFASTPATSQPPTCKPSSTFWLAQVQDPTPGENQAPVDLLADLPLNPALYDALCHRESPYVGIAYFQEEEAPLFFGRDQEIADFYCEYLTKLRPGQVLLLHGASGVGKSSLLQGGLFPRLKQQGWYVGYERRKKEQGSLAQLLRAEVEKALASQAPEKLLILDQVEEIITDPDEEGEWETFFAALDQVSQQNPALKLTLAFRKEYLYEVKKAMGDRKINFQEFPLYPLSEEGLRRAITGVFASEKVREQMRAVREGSLEPALVDALVADIARDEASHRAPLLQYQLQSLYAQACPPGYSGPARLTLAQYQQQRSQSLADFLEQEKLPKIEQQFPEEMAVGLVEDLLYYYSTEDLTAATRAQADFLARYAHLEQPRLLALQQALQDQYLLLRLPDREDIYAP